MNPWIMEPAGAGDSRNRRVGAGLALLIALYIVAVVVFIIVY
ncbi:MAG: hypothetical protein ACREQ2_22315 [Candidatus Binatia bacterium]